MSKKNQISAQHITNRIFTIRGEQVMLDRDLAEMYQVQVKRLNEQVRRNINRFPESFRFQLSNEEKDELVANCDRFETLKHSSVNPHAFTEQGVAMLSAVLHSDIAVQISIQIMNAFVQMRKLIGQEAVQQLRLSNIEDKLVEHSQKFDQLFKALEHEELPKKGIFYNGQVFDAYTFLADLIRKADKSLILIDNYIDDSVFTLFTKRKKNVDFTCYTKTINKSLRLDLKKHNEQYTPIQLKQLNESHDRFLIIDEKELYHIGASIKDLGKKWFAFSKMDITAFSLLKQLKNKSRKI